MYKTKPNPQAMTETPRCKTVPAAATPGDSEADNNQSYEDFVELYFHSDWQGWAWEPAPTTKRKA